MIPTLRRFLAPLLLLLTTACYQVDLYITEWPPETSGSEAVYATGNFNGWKEADPQFRFKLLEDGRWHTRLPSMAGTLKFKVHRGSWSTLESDSCGNELEHQFSILYSTALTLQVAHWKDYSSNRCDFVEVRLDKAHPFPKSDDLYACGPFNDWKLGDKRYRFQQDSTGVWKVRLPRWAGPLEYQVNRGNWNCIEADSLGLPVVRVVDNPTPGTPEVLSIEDWTDRVAQTHPGVYLSVEVPRPVRPEDALYLAADFNNWNPSSEAHRLSFDPATGRYGIWIRRVKPSLYFKLTRGGWETVETDALGKDIDNRVWHFQKKDTLQIRVDGWIDRPAL